MATGFFTLPQSLLGPPYVIVSELYMVVHTITAIRKTLIFSSTDGYGKKNFDHICGRSEALTKRYVMHVNDIKTNLRYI